MEEKTKYFKEYLKKDILKNNSFDCAEIADDFLGRFGHGKLLTITVEQNKNEFFNVTEFGDTVECVYHTVYTDGEYVYDPRYKGEPIKEDTYIQEIRDMNTKKLNVEQE